MQNNDLIINFTPTGMVPSKKDTPHVPISANEIIEQVHEAYEIGITLVHLHARDEDGFPTYKNDFYLPIFEGIRKYCPELVLCASLSGRNHHEIEKRSEVLSLMPDLGSLTLSSLNFSNQASINAPETILGLVNIMNKYGVNPELECFDSGMINFAKYLINKEMITPPFYFNLIFGNVASTQADAAYIGLAIRDLPANSYWALGGIGQYQLVMNTFGIMLGGGMRIGIEDNIWFDKGRKVLTTNAMLLHRAHSLAEVFERKVMKPETFGKLGFYNKSENK